MSATAISGSRVDLSWGTASDNVGVTGYRVERCQGAGCSNFAQIATTAGTTTSYSDTTASAGTSYSYRVRANDAAANLGPYSNTATTTTPGAHGPTPVAAFAFDEGSGSVVSDGSGSGNNGSVANTAWVAGKYGQALSFNGTSSRVTVPDSASLHLSSAMTLEAWVNPATVTAAWRDVIYKGNDNYYLEGTSDNAGRPARGGRSAPTLRHLGAGGEHVVVSGGQLRQDDDPSVRERHPGRRLLPPPGRSPARPTRSRSAATRSTGSTSRG